MGIKFNWGWPQVAVFGIVVSACVAMVITKSVDSSEMIKYFGAFIMGLVGPSPVSMQLDKPAQ